MKIETPQILWHSDADSTVSKIWAAPLSGVSLIQSGRNGSTAPSPLQAPPSPSYCLATAGRGTDLHLWKVVFPKSTVRGTTSEDDCNMENDDCEDRMKVDDTASPESMETQEKLELDVSKQTHSMTSVSQNIVASSSAALSTAERTTSSTSNANSGSATTTTTQIEFICALSRHEGPINAVAFSPNGCHLATAGETGCLIIWSIPPTCLAHQNGTKLAKDYWVDAVRKESDLTVQIVSAPVAGGSSSAAALATSVTDVSWSADSKRIMAGTMDGSVFVLEHKKNLCDGSVNATKWEWQMVYQNSSLHSHYVQGVAFDPSNVYLASQSSDRSVRVLQRKAVATPPLPPRTPQVGPAVEAGGTGTRNHILPTTASPVVVGTPATATAVSSLSPFQDAANVSTQSAAKKILQPNNHCGTATVATAAGTTTTPAEVGRAVVSSHSATASNHQAPIAVAVSLPERTAAAAAALAHHLTESKLEVSHKTKQIKFRSTTSSSITTNVEGSIPNTNATTTSNKQHLYEGETLLKSFVRRLAWTADGAYLVTPAAIWSTATTNDNTTALQLQNGTANNGGATPVPVSISTGATAGGTYATLLHQRHRFDEPWKVLGGLEKPSIAVCPNPVLYQLPEACTTTSATTPVNASTAATVRSVTSDGGVISSENKDDSKENIVRSNATPRSPLDRHSALPYRTIFAVLTWDSVLIYDTVHDQPLAVVRGIHYAHLVDATWTPDGRNLVVCSTDGYISILRFDAGELGEVYVPPAPASTSVSPSLRLLSPSNSGLATAAVAPRIATASAGVVQSRLPPCEPGPAVIHCPPAKRAKTRIAPTLLSASSVGLSALSAATTNTSSDFIAVPGKDATTDPVETSVESSSHKRSATDAAIAVDKLSLSDDTTGVAASTASVASMPHTQPMKKQKKRIPLMSVS